MELPIIKGTRHQKIIGDFGENLVCNWLSRSGFEVTRADHTGLDIIAYNPQTGERLGISVKSRTRVKAQETASVNLCSHQNRKDEVKTFLTADFMTTAKAELPGKQHELADRCDARQQ